MVRSVKSGYKKTDVGIIPNDWQVKNLGRLFEITSSKRVFRHEWKSQGVPFYRAREIAALETADTINNELFIERELYEKYKHSYGAPKKGDILVTGIGTLGKVYVVPNNKPFYFKDGNVIWFKIEGKINPQFLKQLFSTPLIEKQIYGSSPGSTVGSYTISAANKTVVPFPSLEEQTAIAEALADIDSWIESLRRLVQKKRDIKTAAMQELLTGKTRLPRFTEKWATKPLGGIAKFQGKGFRPASFATPSGSIPFIISSENEKMCAVADFDFEALIIGDGGYANVHYKNTPFSASDHTYILTTDDEIAVLQYVYFFLAHNLELIEAGFKGIGVRNISKNYIKEIAIPLPPIAEQAAIANLLADMDADIVAQERLLEKAENVKIATMQELLTGKTRLPASPPKRTQT